MPNGGHGLDSARGAEETAPAVSNITLTNAQFRELLEAVTTSATAAATRQNSENHNETFQGSSTHQVGSFTNCSHRFDGSPSADVEVELFQKNMYVIKRRGLFLRVNPLAYRVGWK
ncbi:hypothetical protein MTP99_007031 [Tenebrio molitor]|jgi:hypothetical protein|nr:hypothetical protein MTP99_007031 [Tenebrio molitor]CAH1368007.1 unnamed protein product [Tenebrio molitor]